MTGIRRVATVRFDLDLWDRLCVMAELLGVGKAELIRDALREHLVRLEHQLTHSELEERLLTVEQRVEGLASAIALLARRIREAFR